MSADSTCRAFRARLERALEGRPLPSELAELAWHAHLLTCDACRELLGREEALEQLLATLPSPKLPRALVERVLARLRRADDALDALLELDRAASPPADLAARVLRGLQASALAEDERRLDALLELDRRLALPRGLEGRLLQALRASPELRLERALELDRELVAPAGLAQRVLRSLEPERRRALRAAPGSSRRRLWLAAAAVAAFALVPLLLEEPADPAAPELVASMQRDEALRAFLAEGGLEILQEPLLWAPDEDIELALATSLDPRYEVVLEFEGDEFAEEAR